MNLRFTPMRSYFWFLYFKSQKSCKIFALAILLVSPTERIWQRGNCSREYDDILISVIFYRYHYLIIKNRPISRYDQMAFFDRSLFLVASRSLFGRQKCHFYLYFLESRSRVTSDDLKRFESLTSYLRAEWTTVSLKKKVQT